MAEIKLLRGEIAYVDDVDFNIINQLKWHLSGSGYARARPGMDCDIFMHRFIMGDPPFPKADVDHINGNRLDNRRCNLRWATRSQNLRNKRKSSKPGQLSRYKGVYFVKRNTLRPWISRIKICGKVRSLGHFATEADAAQSYNEGAQRFHGEFAKLNEIYKDNR